LLTGFLTLDEAVSGFSNKAVLTVGLMFILSAALVKTGFVEVLAERLSRLAGNAWVAIGLFLVATSFISGLINNTAAVAIFIPLAMHLSQRFQISPSKLLIPLSYAGIYGGMLTLIGTSTNLLVSSMVEQQGLPPLGMFEFFGMGLIFMAVGTVYNVFLVPRILSSRAGVSSLTGKYHLSAYLTEFEIGEGSPLIGSTCLQRAVNQKYDITILAIIRGDSRIENDLRNQELRGGDILIARGTLTNFVRFREEEKVLMLTDTKMNQTELTRGESTIVEGLVTQDSSLIGNTLKDINFRNKFSSFVLAVRREGKTLREKIARIPLQFADTLLILVPRSSLSVLFNNPDLAILQEHDIRLHKVRFWWLAIAIIPLVMFIAVSGKTDILQAALIGTVVLLILRAITVQEAYRSVNWSVIVLIAAFVPVGIAMERSGAADILGSSIATFAHFFPDELAPRAAMSSLFFVAAFITSIMSNNTAAIALVPVAFSIASQMG
ncbi:MAG: SLC13 family permease, partial [Candidatus Marinimicrobia bacterium]|nr:SLC13 family permease [Candidatus Neomarinimicrobiota bacterium]